MLLSLLRLIPGTQVRRGEEVFVILDILDAEHVLVESVKTQEKDKVLAAELTPIELTSPDQAQDLADISSKQWERALMIYGHIKSLVELGPGQRIRTDVEAVAQRLKKHPSTVYRWLNAYESTGLVSSLIRSERKDRGESRLFPEVEKIIQVTINDFYLKEQESSPAATAHEVKKRCKKKGFPAPDPATVRNRIFQISEEKRVARRKSFKAAKEKFFPIRGHFPGADWPLAVVQIDHTPMDVIVVDDLHRLPINRAYLTLATDVFSRTTVGFYISLDPPGALATGICISSAILSKEAFLARLGIDLPWPCWGVMRTIHTDNAAEFRGQMLGRACERYGIILEHRPKGSPNYGGHVERLFRTYMKNIHDELPGTTFSNVAERGEYDSEGLAVMTIDALETWFTMFLLGVYHQRPHKGIDGLPPIVKWNEGILGSDSQLGTGIPARVPDETLLKLDFLPYVERTVQRYGIIRNGIFYWSDSLRHLVLAKDPENPKHLRKFICRYDPRNLSCLWLYFPDNNQYIKVPYRDLSRPPISDWELREAQRRLKKKSLDSTNEELIFKTIDDMRALVEEESLKKKSARRMRQRRKGWSKASIEAPASTITKTPSPVLEDTAVREDAIDFEEILPFEDIKEPE